MARLSFTIILCASFMYVPAAATKEWETGEMIDPITDEKTFYTKTEAINGNRPLLDPAMFSFVCRPLGKDAIVITWPLSQHLKQDTVDVIIRFDNEPASTISLEAGDTQTFLISPSNDFLYNFIDRHKFAARIMLKDEVHTVVFDIEKAPIHIHAVLENCMKESNMHRR